METSEIKILNKDGKIYAFLKGGISFSLDLKFDVSKHVFHAFSESFSEPLENYRVSSFRNLEGELVLVFEPFPRLSKQDLNYIFRRVHKIRSICNIDQTSVLKIKRIFSEILDRIPRDNPRYSDVRILIHDFIRGPVGDTFTWKREIVPSFLEKLEVML